MDESRLDDLLDRYQELLDDGLVPVLDELCRDCPDLRAELGRRVVRLHQLGRVLGDPALMAPPQEMLSLSDDRTWVSGTGVGDVTHVEIPAPPGYEVVEPLGEGGMGVVYKARQLGLDRLVALKMILGGNRARAIDLARFRDESRSIAALRHPNIVQVYEVGEFRQQPFFSLEFCAGGTLAKALNGQPQAPALAARMTEVLSRAIQSAHEKNIIHRDLKPANVLLSVESKEQGGGQSTMVGDGPTADWAHDALRDPEATFKVTDFGLAKRVDDDSGRTIDGSVMGTPSYMAPEQARGDLKAVGRPADIWALGAVLYELLTGRPPFKGSTVLDTLELVRSRDPVPVRYLQPKVPADLETICLKCLRKDPRQRYASAAALAADLKRFRDGRPILARPVGYLTRAYRWCQREPRTAALVTALLLLFAGLPAFVVGFESRLARTMDRMEEQRKATVAAHKAERISYLGEQAQRYSAGINEAGRRRALHRTGWTWVARDRLADAALADTPKRNPFVLRSELASALGGIDLRSIAGLAEGLQAGALAFDPKGRLAIAPQFSQPLAGVRFVVLIDPVAKSECRLPFPGTLTWKWTDMTTALAFSPDGRWLYLGLRSGTVVRWDLDAMPDPTRTGWDAHTGQVVEIAFSPDSKWVYTASYDGQVKRWPIDGDGKAAAAAWPAKPADPKDRHRTGLAYWPGPRAGMLAHGPGGARLLDPDTLAELGPAADQVLPKLPLSFGRVVAHPASGTVLVEHGDNVDVVYWERGICQTVASLRDPVLDNGCAHTDRVESVSVHPSGILAATVCPEEGLAKVWDLAAGEMVASVPAANGRAVAFSPDGKTLAVGGDHITNVYEIGGLREQTYLGHRGLPIRAIGRTADGLVGTIAARRHPDNLKHASTVASIWTADGMLRQTVVHRDDGPVVTGQYEVAASPTSGWTAFHTGDADLIWRGSDGTLKPVAAGFEPSTYFDLSLDPTGRAWTIEGGNKVGLREPGEPGKARMVPAGLSFGVRRRLVSVRAAGEFLVVGCENADLRVVRPTGGPVRECACFERTSATLGTDRANTVRAIDVTGDETRAIAGTEDGYLWLVGLPDATPLAHWPAHADRVTAVAFDRTGDWLASGGRDREVRLWKQSGTTYDPYLTLRLPRPVRQVAFLDDGSALLVLLEGETAVRVWHLDRLQDQFREARIDP